MISYHIISRKNPIDKTVKYYPSIDTQHPVSKEDLLERLEKRSTMSSADIKGCVDALEFEIKQCLLDGRSVRLGDLGSFHLSLTSEGSPSAEKVTAANIKRVRVQFWPSSALMRDVQPASSPAKGKARFIGEAKKDETASGD